MCSADEGGGLISPPHRSPALLPQIYLLSRDDCEDLAAWLCACGFPADCYHAGMAAGARVAVQNAWQRGTVRVVCATIAYGMGIDHPGVRFVVHATLPKSVEGYVRQ